MTEPGAAPGGAVEQKPTYAGRWVSASLGPEGLRTELSARTHRLTADEPIALGGTDEGPNPFEMLLFALGSCMAMTMRMYAGRKGWPMDGVQVHLRMAPKKDPGPEAHMVGARRVSHVEQRIEITGALTDEQCRRLTEIGGRCPVKRALEGGIEVIDASVPAG